MNAPRLVARTTSVLRCAVCHDVLEAGVVECPRCHTKLHDECVEVRCPTLGCRHSFREPIRILRRPRHGWSWFFGVIFPALALLVNLATTSGIGVPQAKNERNSYWLCSFAPEVQAWFYPLLLWSFVAYGAWIRGHRASWVRVGLWGGIAVSAAFAVAYSVVLHAVLLLCIFAVGLLGLAPYTTTLAFMRATIRYEGSPGPPTGRASLLGLAGLYWALAAEATVKAHESLERVYGALPSDYYSDCYLVTVAARGDRRVTGSEPVLLGDGRVLLVSTQLRRFKAFELVLAARTPRLHRAIRALYDRVGPRLAARVTPRGATALHVALKPVELALALALWTLVEEPERLLSATYARRDDGLPLPDPPPLRGGGSPRAGAQS